MPRLGVTSHDQGLDGPASVAEISVYLEIDVQGVGNTLRKSGFGAAYRARVSCLGLGRMIGRTHVISFVLRPRCCLVLFVGALPPIGPDFPDSKKNHCSKLNIFANLSTGFRAK